MDSAREARAAATWILRLQVIVCRRDGKEDAGQLKATRIYPEEAKNLSFVERRALDASVHQD